MDREFVFTALTLAIVGPALVVSAAWPWQTERQATARHWERICWRALWAPLFPGIIGVSVLLGWVAIEPDDSERLPFSVLIVSTLFAGVWLRALVRATWALRSGRPRPVAGTVGLWRPRVVLGEEFIAQLDGGALSAVAAHEAAHVQHGDPFRIWLGQLATDLQWPWPGARNRFDKWRGVLELARDEEARLSGVDGADLAAAILLATRLSTAGSTGAALVDPQTGLQDRIARLLAPLPSDHSPSERTGRVLAMTSTCLVGALCGVCFGERFVQFITRFLP